MTVPANHLYRVELLSESQIAQFKRDGMLVLPGVLDLDLCRRARDQMWEIIAEHRPSMQRDDPATWVPFSEEEENSYKRPTGAASIARRPSGQILQTFTEQFLTNKLPE